MMASDYIRAARSRRLGNQGSKARRDLLQAALQNAYLLKGVPVNAQSLTGTVNVLDGELAAFGDLRTGELEGALKAGVTRLYGDDDYISAANVLRWVRTYLECNERREALAADAREAERARESAGLAAYEPQEYARRKAEFLRNAPTLEWNAYVAAGGRLDIRSDGYAAAVYDALKRLGKVHPSAETLAEARAQAERDINAKHRQGSGLIGSLALISGSCGDAETRTKRILLERYFDSLYRRGVTPNFQPQNTTNNDTDA